MGQLCVQGVTKAYKRYPRKWGRLAEWLRLGNFHRDIWVLNDVSFEVAPGEAVGIIGVNGAGKSTLLKIITGTTKPTAGNVEIKGRVSALLELGMGFHPEFTGRQNCYIAGQLHGLTTQEIDALLPEIAEFAEIGDYLDQPVRTYSSGMQVRLAFSLASAKRPEILIIDEALSVGDTYFQHKSFDRIRWFKDLGTTLLFVSHDRSAVQALCDRAILLSHGTVLKDGVPSEVTDYYNALISQKENVQIQIAELEDGAKQTSSGSGEATVKDVQLLNAEGAPIEEVDVGELISLKIEVRVNSDIPLLVLGYAVKDRLGQPMFGTNTYHLECAAENVRKGDVLVYTFDFHANLGVGSYSISTALHGGETHLDGNFEWRDLALVFKVANYSKASFIGMNWCPPKISIGR